MPWNQLLPYSTVKAGKLSRFVKAGCLWPLGLILGLSLSVTAYGKPRLNKKTKPPTKIWSLQFNKSAQVYQFTAKGLKKKNGKTRYALYFKNGKKLKKKWVSAEEVQRVANALGQLVVQNKFAPGANSPEKPCKPFAKASAFEESITLCLNNKKDVRQTFGLLKKLQQKFE